MRPRAAGGATSFGSLRGEIAFHRKNGEAPVIWHLRAICVALILAAATCPAKATPVTFALGGGSNLNLQFGLFENAVTDTAAFSATGSLVQDVTKTTQAPFGTIINSSQFQSGSNVALSGADNSYLLNLGFFGTLSITVSNLRLGTTGPATAFQPPPTAAGTTQFPLTGSSLILNSGTLTYTGMGNASALGTQVINFSVTPLNLGFTSGSMTLVANDVGASTQIASTLPVAASGLFTTILDLFEVRVTLSGSLASTGTLGGGGTTLVGDANGDCSVGAADYALWAAQFGQSGASLSADFDHNGSVGAGDYALWAANFGNTCPPGGGAGAASVPEPASACLALFALVSGWAVCRGRRN